MPFATEQEAFWAGTFGDDYADRNAGAALLAGSLHLFSRALSRTNGVASVLEFGANVGMNMRAISLLLPKASLSAVEINAKACKRLRELPGLEVTEGSLFDYKAPLRFDLAMMCGVMIHLAPEKLPAAYDVLASSSSRYVLLSEYYNPTPVEIPYRGHSERMYKRDFAGELMDRHPSLHLVDYGCAYRRDPNWLLDDTTWFLLEHR